MATTILQSFEDFKKNLEITGLQESTVSTRQQNVRRVMEAGMDVLDSFLTGSYRRNTMISPLNQADVDIFVVLDAKYFHHYNNGQNGGHAGLIDLVKRTLQKTYTRTPDISRNGQAVTITFEDFVVDVVPAFNRQRGGYLIPNSISRTWIATDPNKHVQLIVAENANHESKLVPLIKMIKAWNKNSNKHFQSFHLEILTMEILRGVKISNYQSAVRFIFDKGRNLIARTMQDPAGYGGNLGSYLDTNEKINVAISKFQNAYEAALKAEDLGARGYIKEAVDLWIKIFGRHFPSYG